ncbi:MAG TPA: hypothetical protein VK464_13095 [Symbiobacteriaceae bacterium]|jgi:hypothetical protein|nr:hypothetical protein [Symbiobacteriaceae bacterium]
MTKNKSIRIRPEEITLDEHGKVVINHPELADSVRVMLTQAVTRGPLDPEVRLLDWNCKCDGVDVDCGKK